jgi:hypothetical protein
VVHHHQLVTYQGASACSDCVAGKYLGTEGNDAATDYELCAKGKYSSALGVSVCLDYHRSASAPKASVMHSSD